MSGALPPVPSAHDMAASSAVASAHGRGLVRAVLTVLAVHCTARDKDAGVRAQRSWHHAAPLQVHGLSHSLATTKVTSAGAVSTSRM